MESTGLKLDNQSYSPEPIQYGQDYFNFKLPKTHNSFICISIIF